MLWKVLSILSALALVVGAWSSYNNRQAIAEERRKAKLATENLALLQAEFANAEASKVAKLKQLEELTAQLEVVKTDVLKAGTDVEQKSAESELVKRNLEEVRKQVKELEEQIAKVGDIPALMATVQDEKKKKEAVDAAIANQQQQLALADGRISKVQADITRVQDLERQQKAGMVDSSFTARVAQAFQEYGFVILNKGNAAGMFANAMLEVKRGRNVVAKLRVRDVEQGMSVADLIPGSLADGTSLRAGDLVVAAKEQPKEAAPAPALPQGTVPAPVDGATPAPAPASMDPFAPAPGAAPAPAPAPAPGMAADPFAPAPAPAGGMAPAPSSADPFAPAPAAPAGGTGMSPAAPSTVDPFAPRP